MCCCAAVAPMRNDPADFRPLRLQQPPMPADTALSPAHVMLLILALAAGLRLWSLLTHSYVAFNDETLQYFEQAHRLAYGSGVVPWEFIDGIRSWLLPGLIAGIMRLLSPFEDSPDAYVPAVRLCFVAMSLVVPWLGWRIGEARFGLPGAVAGGLMGAFSYELVYFAPAVMTEALAAHIALLALYLGETAPGGGMMAMRRLVFTGALFGVAAVLRYQYAPALALAALWQHGRSLREVLVLAIGALVTVLLFGGVLDAFTYGAPFQTIWLNFQRNALDGISVAMGTEPWYYPVAYFAAAWGGLAPLLALLALVGAMATPSLALLMMATLAVHMLSPHKELRFTYLALAIMPLLIGYGIAGVLRAAGRLRWLPGWACGAAAVAILATLLAGGEAMIARRHATPLDAWHRNRSTLLAYAAARNVPGLCGLGVRTEWVYFTGGYTYLHRDVPIYFETFAAAQRLEGSGFHMRLKVVRDGRPVPQYPDLALLGATDRFNVLIGRFWDRLPGFVPVACFGRGTADDRRICVFHRPGPCA